MFGKKRSTEIEKAWCADDAAGNTGCHRRKLKPGEFVSQFKKALCGIEVANVLLRPRPCLCETSFSRLRDKSSQLVLQPVFIVFKIDMFLDVAWGWFSPKTKNPGGLGSGWIIEKARVSKHNSAPFSNFVFQTFMQLPLLPILSWPDIPLLGRDARIRVKKKKENNPTPDCLGNFQRWMPKRAG